MKTHHRTHVAAGCILRLAVAAILLSGCALPNRLKQVKRDICPVEHVQIVYSVRNGQGNVPRLAVEQTGLNEPVAGTSKDSSGRWKTARLKIEYPHPDAGAGMARATLVLSQGELSAPAESTFGKRIAEGFNRLKSHCPEPDARPTCICATSSGPDDEIWVLDVPQQQVDSLLTELENAGFFQSQTRTAGGAELDVAVGHNRTQKPWSTDPRLDEFVTRVFHEGMLEGFVSANVCDDSIDRTSH